MVSFSGPSWGADIGPGARLPKQQFWRNGTPPLRPVKLENQPFQEVRGHLEENYLDFNVYLVMAIALVYFA